MSCTLADIKSIFPKQACDMTDSQLVNLFKFSVMPDLQKYLYQNFPNEFIQSTTIPMVNGTNTYTIPAYGSIVGVFGSDCKKICEGNPMDCNIKDSSYYISGNSLIVSTKRDFTSVTVKYMKPLDTITSALDPLPFSQQLCNQIKPIIADYLLSYYFRTEGMMEDAGKYLEQANAKLESNAKIGMMSISLDSGDACGTCTCKKETCH